MQSKGLSCINNYLKCKLIKYPTKRHRLAEWIQKKTHIYAVYKKPTSDLKTHKLKVRGCKNIFHENGKQKKAGVVILISDKIDPKIKKNPRDGGAWWAAICGVAQSLTRLKQLSSNKR